LGHVNLALIFDYILVLGHVNLALILRTVVRLVNIFNCFTYDWKVKNESKVDMTQNKDVVKDESKVMNPDMTPCRMSLDISLSTKIFFLKRYNTHLILIRFLNL
jgi:hypothetical protein